MHRVEKNPKMGSIAGGKPFNNRFFSLQISLSQDDLILLMSILLENLSEAAADPKVTHSTLPDAQKFKKHKAVAVAGLDEGTSFPKVEHLIQIVAKRII